MQLMFANRFGSGLRADSSNEATVEDDCAVNETVPSAKAVRSSAMRYGVFIV